MDGISPEERILDLALKLERYKALISNAEPNALEALVRGLLIHYFFHVSNKNIVEVRTTTPDAAKVVNLLTPTVFRGGGRIRLGATTVFGVPQSPGGYSCSYIEARTHTAVIEIDDETVLNNRATLISEGAGIRIGKRCLIGFELQVLDTNAHELDIGRRHMADQKPEAVEIGDDVFIGSRVTILKGSRIGNGCVIAAGSVVTPRFVAPPMSIIAGNPSRVVGRVKQAT
jgi:acetyltransferase-like isoleucine patch superfamily enzyme